MTIVGPAHLAGSDNLDCRTKMYFQSFQDSVDRGLESIQVRMWRTQNNFSPNLLTNPTFAVSPFLTTTPQRWRLIGQYGSTFYKWTWSAGQVNVNLPGGGSGDFYGEWVAIFPGMRTPVYGQDGNPLQLEAGWNGEFVLGIAGGASAGTKTFVLKAYNADGTESFSQTINVPSASAQTNYTLSFTTTVAWRGVYLEVKASNAQNVTVANPTLIKFASFRYQIPTLNGLVKLNVHQDLNGRPGARVGTATTTKNINTDLTTSAANYLFSFATPIFLKGGVKYHFSITIDTTELANWTVGTGADNIVYVVGDLASTTYPDGQLTQYTFGTGFVTAIGANGDLYFQINYSDTVPASGSRPITVAWDCDCVVQYGRVTKLVTDAETLLDVRAAGLNRQRIEVASASEPGLGRWQSEWLLRGNALPIPDGTELLWFNTGTNKFGGVWFMNGTVLTRLESGDLIYNPFLMNSAGNGGYADPALQNSAGVSGTPNQWRGWGSPGWFSSDGMGNDVTIINKYRCMVLLTLRLSSFAAATTKFQVFVDGIPEGIEEAGAANINLDSAVIAGATPGAVFQEQCVSWLVKDPLEPGTHHITWSIYNGSGGLFFGYPVVGGSTDKFSLVEVIRVP